MSDPKEKTQETPKTDSVDPAMAGFAGSSNEPEGSQTQPPPEQPGVKAEPDPAAKHEPEEAQQTQAPRERDPLPSEAELSAMTRPELDELAEDRGLDPDECGTKAEVIAMLRKDARKRGSKSE
jgi:hypothetical protein